MAKDLVIFKDKCRVGPHIPLQIIKFNVYRDLKAIVVQMVNYFWSSPTDGIETCILQLQKFPIDYSRDKTLQSKRL